MTEIERLQHICENWLDNADLDLSFRPDGSIFMNFIVGGSTDLIHYIDIECRGIHIFNVLKDWKDEFEGIIIRGATVEKFNSEVAVKTEIANVDFITISVGEYPKQLYRFETNGAARIQVLCTELIARERHATVGSSTEQ